MMRYLMLVFLFWSYECSLRAANYYYVATNGAGGDFKSWGTAASSIQDAVNAACGAVDNTVLVSNGAYRLTNQVEITNRIVLKGLNGYSNTLVYADWPAWTTRCFSVTHTGTLDGFTVSNGHFWISNDYSGGGGAYLSNGTIQNCYFINNSCSNRGARPGGGGIYIGNYGVVSNCIFVSNMVYGSTAHLGISGGGVFDRGNSMIVGCSFISNGGALFSGGGLYTAELFGRPTIVSNCFFAFNSAGAQHGGGAALERSALMTDCIVSNNVAANGAGICFRNPGSTLMNSKIINNNAVGGLGAITFSYAGVVSNCIIAGNERCGIHMNAAGAIVDGCHIMNNSRSAVYNKLTGVLKNCLIYNNTNLSSEGYHAYYFGQGAVCLTNASMFNCTIVNNYGANECGGVVMRGTNNYVANCVIAGNTSSLSNYPNLYYSDNAAVNMSNVYNCCVITTDAYLMADGRDNITNNPSFVDAEAGNWRLQPGSPCVNKGANMDWMTNAVDLDGKARIRYGIVDMGAYECIFKGTVFWLR